MKKSIAVFVVIELLVFWGCASLSDDCGFFNSGNADVADINFSAIRFDRVGNVAVLNTNDSVRFQDYALLVDITPLFTSMKQSFGFSNAAYACSPAVATLTEKIEQVKLISVLDYNGEIIAGDEVTSMAEVMTRSGKIPLNDLAKINEVLASQFYVFITLKEAPTRTSLYQFDLELETNKGKKFNLSTNPVFIIP